MEKRLHISSLVRVRVIRLNLLLPLFAAILCSVKVGGATLHSRQDLRSTSEHQKRFRSSRSNKSNHRHGSSVGAAFRSRFEKKNGSEIQSQSQSRSPSVQFFRVYVSLPSIHHRNDRRNSNAHVQDEYEYSIQLLELPLYRGNKSRSSRKESTHFEKQHVEKENAKREIEGASWEHMRQYTQSHSISLQSLRDYYTLSLPKRPCVNDLVIGDAQHCKQRFLLSLVSMKTNNRGDAGISSGKKVHVLDRVYKEIGHDRHHPQKQNTIYLFLNGSKSIIEDSFVLKEVGNVQDVSVDFELLVMNRHSTTCSPSFNGTELKMMERESEHINIDMKMHSEKTVFPLSSVELHPNQLEMKPIPSPVARESSSCYTFGPIFTSKVQQGKERTRCPLPYKLLIGLVLFLSSTVLYISNAESVAILPLSIPMPSFGLILDAYSPTRLIVSAVTSITILLKSMLTSVESIKQYCGGILCRPIGSIGWMRRAWSIKTSNAARFLMTWIFIKAWEWASDILLIQAENLFRRGLSQDFDNNGNFEDEITANNSSRVVSPDRETGSIENDLSQRLSNFPTSPEVDISDRHSPISFLTGKPKVSSPLSRDLCQIEGVKVHNSPHRKCLSSASRPDATSDVHNIDNVLQNHQDPGNCENCQNEIERDLSERSDVDSVVSPPGVSRRIHPMLFSASQFIQFYPFERSKLMQEDGQRSCWMEDECKEAGPVPDTAVEVGEDLPCLAKKELNSLTSTCNTEEYRVLVSSFVSNEEANPSDGCLLIESASALRLEDANSALPDPLAEASKRISPKPLNGSPPEADIKGQIEDPPTDADLHDIDLPASFPAEDHGGFVVALKPLSTTESVAETLMCARSKGTSVVTSRIQKSMKKTTAPFSTSNLAQNFKNLSVLEMIHDGIKAGSRKENNDDVGISTTQLDGTNMISPNGTIQDRYTFIASDSRDCLCEKESDTSSAMITQPKLPSTFHSEQLANVNQKHLLSDREEIPESFEADGCHSSTTLNYLGGVYDASEANSLQVISSAAAHEPIVKEIHKDSQYSECIESQGRMESKCLDGCEDSIQNESTVASVRLPAINDNSIFTSLYHQNSIKCETAIETSRSKPVPIVQHKSGADRDFIGKIKAGKNCTSEHPVPLMGAVPDRVPSTDLFSIAEIFKTPVWEFSEVETVPPRKRKYANSSTCMPKSEGRTVTVSNRPRTKIVEKSKLATNAACHREMNRRQSKRKRKTIDIPLTVILSKNQDGCIPRPKRRSRPTRSKAKKDVCVTDDFQLPSFDAQSKAGKTNGIMSHSGDSSSERSRSY